MRGAGRFSSWEKQVFLVGFSLTIPRKSAQIQKPTKNQSICKQDVLRNFAKFTVKQLCHSLFFNKAAGLKSAILLNKRLWYRYFPVNFAKFLRTPFLIKHLRWLLLRGTLRVWFPSGVTFTRGLRSPLSLVKLIFLYTCSTEVKSHPGIHLCLEDRDETHYGGNSA